MELLATFKENIVYYLTIGNNNRRVRCVLSNKVPRVVSIKENNNTYTGFLNSDLNAKSTPDTIHIDGIGTFNIHEIEKKIHIESFVEAGKIVGNISVPIDKAVIAHVKRTRKRGILRLVRWELITYKITTNQISKFRIEIRLNGKKIPGLMINLKKTVEDHQYLVRPKTKPFGKKVTGVSLKSLKASYLRILKIYFKQ